MASSISTEYKYVLNGFSWAIDGNLIGSTTIAQSGPGSNVSERALYTFQVSRTEASSSDAIKGHMLDPTIL